MASYHFSAQIISRGKGRSAIAAAAYRSASRLTDRTTGKNYDFTEKRGVVYTEIMLPKGAASWLADRQRLWSHAEARETRKDSQLAREINFALPHELSAEDRLALVRTFAAEQFVSRGMVADIAIHAPVGERGQDDRNHHAHIMLTLRQAGSEGLSRSKTREWNSKEELKAWRANWSAHQNRFLAAANVRDRVDHRSLADQRSEAVERNDIARARTLDRLPEIHVGPRAAAMHQAERRPRALTMPLVPPPDSPRLPAQAAPLPIERSLPSQTHRQATAALVPDLVLPTGPPVLPLPHAPPQAPLLPDRRPPPKPYVAETWQLDIVRKDQRRSREPPTSLFKLRFAETRPRRAWRDRLKPQERLTRLEYNLSRIEKNRSRATQWVRKAQSRQAKSMLAWRSWSNRMHWLVAHGADPGLVQAALRRLLANARLRKELARTIAQAKAEEARLHRRVHEVRLTVARTYVESLDRTRGRHRSRRPASDRKDQ